MHMRDVRDPRSLVSSIEEALSERAQWDKTPTRVGVLIQGSGRLARGPGYRQMPYAPYSVPTGRSTALTSMLKVEVAVDTTIYCRVRRVRDARSI